MKRIGSGVAAVLALSAFLVVMLPLASAQFALRASLPRLDGTAAAAGVAAGVTLERDALGALTVSASSRTDLAFGLGFAHAQDRFFEMDLSRRLAAGELAELVGPGAVGVDRETRSFRFRAVARAALAQAEAPERAVLEAYTRGVNAGLASLAARPWEYWILGVRPTPWRAEDSYLVAHAMWWELQHGDFADEIQRRAINAHLSGADCGDFKCALKFFYPGRTAWDAPNEPDEASLRAADAASAALPDVPIDLALRTGSPAAQSAAVVAPAAAVLGAALPMPSQRGAGSNNWALAGRYTDSGSALIASDMHLPLRVPVMWYRARLRLAAGLDIMGVTLPGTPAVVAGSNGAIAWAFTNSGGHWLDVIAADCRGESSVTETIHVHGAADVTLRVPLAAHGVQIAAGAPQGRCWYGRWLAQLPSATNLRIMELERARTAQQALALAPQLGIPHQNLVVGDRAGHIGWAIAGRVPRDLAAALGGADPAWRALDTAPHLFDPALGRLWSANARATEEPAALAAIAGAEEAFGAHYDRAARARQIRDALLAHSGAASSVDMLALQLDDRALFLERWRDLALRLPLNSEARRLLQSWNGRASTDSAGYWLVRDWHERVSRTVWDMLLRGIGLGAAQREAVPAPFEQTLWRLVTTQPLPLLEARYASWDALLREALEVTENALAARCGTLARCRWGDAHPVRIRHPISAALPWLAGMIDMPTLELPGDHDMPRVQDGAFGASERFAVAPGHESEGFLELPGGQSGHPLSPYYRRGLLDWARGTATPFLPGPTQHRLRLLPGASATIAP